MECNICSGTTWGDQNSRAKVRCLRCNSLERTRALKLILDSLELPKPGSNILHFAPEVSLSSYLANKSPCNYEPVDYNPHLFPSIKNIKKFDIVTDSENLQSNYYDVIIHSHVAEHIPINIAYFFFHFSRSLKPDGYHIFCLPLMPGNYDEYFGPLTEREATERFGQKDHVRKFGISDLNLHLGSIMRLPNNYDLGNYASEELMNHHNIPISQRRGFHGSTVFVARKNDYLLT